MMYLVIALISYILGSLPSGYYIGKYVYKKDIRTMGSGCLLYTSDAADDSPPV